MTRLLAVMLAVVVAPTAAPASACVNVITNETLGGKQSKRAQAASDAALAKRIKAERIARHTAEVRAGHVDVATEIADMLVPNVRAVLIHRSNCGEADEYDTLGELSMDDANDTVFDGTELEGLDPYTNGPLYRASFARDPRACNAEFRQGFASLLRKRLSFEALNRAYIALATEREQFARPGLFQYPNHFRFYKFAGTLRVPPVVRSGGPSELLDSDRPIARVVAEFWAGAKVGDDTICPAEARDFVARREARLAELRTWPDYPKYVREAADRRAARAKPAPVETKP